MLLNDFPQRCLVTGASGFVGNVLCKHLQDEKIHVKVLLRQSTSAASVKGPWDEVVTGSLEALEACPHLFDKVDTVFYLASIAHNKSKASEYQKINVDLCLDFARRALQSGVKSFVYVSSTKAMADPGERCVDESFVDFPTDPYGLSKRKAEDGLLALSKNKETGFEHMVIVRPCLVYGEHLQGNLYALLNQLDKGFFPALPETSARRSMVSVQDLARALLMVARDPKANRQIYLVSDDQPYAVSDIEKAIRAALGKNQPLVSVPTTFLSLLGKTGDIFQKVLPGFPVSSNAVSKLTRSALYSSEKIRREIGWQPTQSFFDVLPDIIRSYQKKKSP